ncbi:MAG TPA: TonB-dependent receptor, partial [Gemmatimonadales bacterium]|nr:TonB-dependent receptor [Gemmatimonadales bacterium]
NNVPAGTVTIRAAFVGYRPVEYTGVRVLAGQTMTQDFTLEQTSVELEPVEIVAEVPLVPRDEVTTRQRIDGAYTENLPVDQVANVLALQPGVVASTQNNGAIQLSIRGGRVDEAVTYIDGVPTTPGFRGQTTLFTGNGVYGAQAQVAPNALEQASVTTGGSSAEFGNAQSGVIAIETRSGGTDYAGSVSYETDEPLGVNHGLGFNRIEVAFGGPVPFLRLPGLSFFASGTLQGQQSVIDGIDRRDNPILVAAGVDTVVAVPSALEDPTADTTYVPVNRFAVYTGDCDDIESSNPAIEDNYGVDCQGIRVPYTARSQSNLTGKLQYTYGTGSRLAFTYLRSQNDLRTRGTQWFNNLYNPQALTGVLQWSNVYSLNWTQNLSKTAERALALETYLSYQQDRVLGGMLTEEAEAGTRDPFGGFLLLTTGDFRYNFQNFPINDELIRNFITNAGGSRRTPFDIENPAQYGFIDRYRNNPYGVTGMNESGLSGTQGSNIHQRQEMYRENRLVLKSNLDWQVDRYNRLRLGGEFTQYWALKYSHALTSQAFSDVWKEEPVRYNLFVEDRLDLGDVVVVGGLRYDFYDTRSSRPAYPRIFSMPGFDPNNPTAQFVEDESHDYLSPHIQVSFPVTDRTNFRLSYAHQVQQPDFETLFLGKNTDLAVTNTNSVFGADLDFGKTITFEFGIRHAFGDDMVLDISAYNRDKLSDAAGRLINVIDPLTNAPTDIRRFTTADFGNSRGVDIRLDRRFGRFFNGVIGYSFQEAKNTGTDPFTYINFGSRILNALTGTNAPPPQAILNTQTNRPHTLTGQLALNFPDDFRQGTTLGQILRNVGAFATFTYTSGTAYTRCLRGTASEGVITGATTSVCGRAPFGSDINAVRLPAYRNVDLRITKGFAIGALDVTAYADIRNLFNFRNILFVHMTTGDITDQLERQQSFSADSSLLAEEASTVGVYGEDASVDLRFGAAGNAGCAAWTTGDGTPAAPNCIYLIRAEERYGNGDHVFTLEEQRAAFGAAYLAGFAPTVQGAAVNGSRGVEAFTGQPRWVRFGLQLNF